MRQKVEQVLKDFQTFVGDLPIVGYNAAKVICLFSWSMVLIIVTSIRLIYMRAFERRSSDLHGIANLKLQTVANFLGFHGKSHNSLEDARMTARVYEGFFGIR